MLLRSIKGILTLVRIVPVISWSFCAILIAVGFALHDLSRFSPVHWAIIVLLSLGALLLQGIVAHSFNDHEDWRSGTDRISKGILSGGSKVIPKGLLKEEHLLVTGFIGLLLVFITGYMLSRLTSNYLWVFVSIGTWAALTYTAPPFRLAYIPFLGEWLAAFPAMASCVLGAYYELTQSFTIPVFWISIIHSLLCIAWLMQHHLSDIDADLAARPRKLTTVAFISRKYGKQHARLPGFFYFLLAFLLSLIAVWKVHPIFLVSLTCSFLGAQAAWKTNPYSIGNITYNQLKMILLTVVHTLFLFSFEVFT